MATLKDYHDEEKLRVYSEMSHCVATLHNYNLALYMPVKDMVILDLPCGPGDYVRKYFKEGAAKVIAIDVVPVLIDVSQKRDKENGVPEGFVEYHVHDARIPKRFSNTLADVCSCLHLFCFAENYDELRSMARTISMNVKPGALCAIIVCSAGANEKEFYKALESHQESVIHFDPQSSNKLVPRKLHSVCNDFNLIRYVWPHDVICKALTEEGFSKTKVTSYKFDPSTENPDYTERYIHETDRKIITAWKDNDQ